MIYEGNGFYTFYSSLGNKIELSEIDIHLILEEYFSTLDDNMQEKIIGELLVRDINTLLSKIRAKEILNHELNNENYCYRVDNKKRPHHPKEYIVKLFERYYDKTNIKLNTKTKVFIKIANELKITPKAVNKAYYSK